MRVGGNQRVLGGLYLELSLWVGQTKSLDTKSLESRGTPTPTKVKYILPPGPPHVL